MRPIILRLCAIAALVSPAFGGDFSFTGTFAQDDERRQFTFNLNQPGTVLLRTWSWAGGVNRAGVQIECGGFDPSLSLFDSTGLLLATNRDGGCNNVNADRVTTWCWDAFIAISLPRGAYTLVLTESENVPRGPYLADPFVYDGTGNFTAAPEVTSPPGFWDFSANRRSNSYAVDISGVDSAQLPLVAAIGALVNSASWQTGPASPNTFLTFFHHSLPAAQPLSVLIDGQSAEILYDGPTQLNFSVPPSAIPQASALLQILCGGNLLLATPLQIVDASPALFTANQSGTGQASALNQDYTYNGASAPAVPAARGSILMLYGTGFGAASPLQQGGLLRLASEVRADIGGRPAEVIFAGLAPASDPSLQQINIRIPDDCPLGAAVPIRLQIGEYSTQPGVTIAVALVDALRDNLPESGSPEGKVDLMLAIPEAANSAPSPLH
jgi:uncharacterized protein (TIGR03437 family)